MKRTARMAALALLAATLLGGASGCIMEDRVVEFVVTEKTCAPFDIDAQTTSFPEVAAIWLSDDLDEALSDNDVSTEDIVTARVASMSYGVTEFSQAHDWDITGSVTVEREDITDGPATLLNYTDQSVQEALGVRIQADLNADGVGLINRALDDYLAGGDPVLVFRIMNSDVSPPPSASDHIVFQWEPCIVTHIVVKEDIEVPDPF